MEKEKEEKQKCQAKITDTTAQQKPRSRRRERCEAQKDSSGSVRLKTERRTVMKEKKKSQCHKPYSETMRTGKTALHKVSLVNPSLRTKLQ